MSTFVFVNPLVSIIMPAKNAEPFLTECINSIILQGYKEWELLVINDNSTDNTFSILKKFDKKDDRISVLNNAGNGIIDALQTGYKSSKGELITRMDADDIMSPDKLNELQSLLQKKGKFHVATGLVKYFSEKELGNGYLKYEQWLNNLCLSNNNFSAIYKECSIPSPCWMMWREDFEKCGGFEHNTYPEDYDLAFRMYQNNLKVIGLGKVLHHWRDSDNRASRTDDNYKDNRFLELKTKYFLSTDYNHDVKLILWGAGKKGKEIAQLLLKDKIDFQWVCNSQSKIGHSIYGTTMQDCNSINLENSQIIIAVANEGEQNEIQKTISNYKNSKYFYFC